MLDREKVLDLYYDKLREYDAIGRDIIDVSLEGEIALLEHILQLDGVSQRRFSPAKVDPKRTEKGVQSGGDKDENKGKPEV